MTPSLLETLGSLAQRLIALAHEDEQLRGELRALAMHVLESTAPSDGAALAAPREGLSEEPALLEAPLLDVVSPAAEAATAEPAADRAAEVLPELTLGQARSHETISIPAVIRWTTPSDADFPIMEARCRLKAEGCRWAASRRRLIAEGAVWATEIEPRDKDIIARAKALPDCFLWMCHRNGPQPADHSLYEIAAAGFDNLADALSLVKQVLDEPGLHEREFEPALDLLAESQSSVRAIVAEMEGLADADQLRAFNWLKATAIENQLFIRRHMRLDDAADPRGWPGLASRIEALDQVLQKAQQRSKHRRKLLGKVRHKASVIAARPEEAEHEWAILIQTVEELVSDGVPPSNSDLRDILLPVIDLLPDVEMPKGCALVLREIDRYAAAAPAAGTAHAVEATPQVREVAALLAGQSLVLIGGERRPAAHAAIVAAFGLKDLLWIETRDHQSIAGFEPYIARSDVVLTLLAIRWSSHSFGETKQFCDKYGKPLVRLPTGYNPSQIAAQILAQCSERLRERVALAPSKPIDRLAAQAG